VRGAIFEGLRVNGVYSFGLLLTYIYQVQQSPYDTPIEFWPDTPASSLIFMLGLMGILFNSLISIFMGSMMKKALVADGFVGGAIRAYDLNAVPKEPNHPESDAPLLNRPGSAPVIRSPRLPLGEKTDLGKRSANAVKDTPLDETAPADVGVGTDPVQASRKKNQKEYNVLSLQEARWVNYFILLEFWTMLLVTAGVGVSALVILLNARSEYQDSIDS
jgi:hypothetical protein